MMRLTVEKQHIEGGGGKPCVYADKAHAYKERMHLSFSPVLETLPTEQRLPFANCSSLLFYIHPVKGVPGPHSCPSNTRLLI